MIVEAVELLAEWLRHPTHGVRALVASVPMRDGDVRPSRLDVLDEVSHDEPAFDQLPNTTWPALTVSLYEAPVDAPYVGHRPVPPHAAVDLLVRCHVPAGANQPAAVRLMGYLLRATMASVARLLATPEGEAARTLRAASVHDIAALRLLEPRTQPDDARIAASLLVTLRLRDTWAADLS